MGRAILIVGLLALFCISRSTQLSCPRCNRNDCDYLDHSSCPFGTVNDICGCCQKCAKGVNEECGGIWGHKGSCGLGYFCQLPNGSVFNGEGTGTCVPEIGTFPVT